MLKIKKKMNHNKQDQKDLQKLNQSLKINKTKHGVIVKMATLTKTEGMESKLGGKKGIKSSDNFSGNNNTSDSEKTENPMQINIE